MTDNLSIESGGILHLKKKHPCGSFDFEIIKAGIDYRLKCITCGHQITISREKLQKSIKSKN